MRCQHKDCISQRSLWRHEHAVFFSRVVGGRKRARANQVPCVLACSLVVWTDYTLQAFATEIASKFACVYGLSGGMERKQH